jgi:hypothetical protein
MRGRNRSLWREESFLLHLLGQAVTPQLSLAEALPHWPVISLQLREAPRRRDLQAARLERELHTLS